MGAESIMLVVKIGGSAGIDLEAFLTDIASLDEPLILVHGANAELDALTRRLGTEPTLVTSADGQVSRFTDATTMDLFLMVYAGKVNKRIVEGLTRRGRKAVGLCGMDGGIVKARRKDAIRIVENGKRAGAAGRFRRKYREHRSVPAALPARRRLHSGSMPSGGQ